MPNITLVDKKTYEKALPECLGKFKESLEDNLQKVELSDKFSSHYPVFHIVKKETNEILYAFVIIITFDNFSSDPIIVNPARNMDMLKETSEGTTKAAIITIQIDRNNLKYLRHKMEIQ